MLSHMDSGGGGEIQVLCTFAHSLPIQHSVMYFTGSHGGRGQYGKGKTSALECCMFCRYISWQFTFHQTPANWAMVTCQRLHYWTIILLCKVCGLSIQCPLPALTDPGQVQIWLHTSQLNKLSLIIASLFWSFHFFHFYHSLGCFCVFYFLE